MKKIGLIGGMSWEANKKKKGEFKISKAFLGVFRVGSIVGENTNNGRIINKKVREDLGGFHSAKCIQESYLLSVFSPTTIAEEINNKKKGEFKISRTFLGVFRVGSIVGENTNNWREED